MQDVPGGLKYHRSMQFVPGFGAEYAERTDKDGHDYIAVKLVNNPEDGRYQEFWTDLDRLDDFLRRADDYLRKSVGEETAWLTERVGTIQASFVGWPPHDPTDRVAIYLSQSNGQMSQNFTIDTKRLKSAIAFGKEVEQALGYHQRWQTLVYYESVQDGFNARPKATVFKSVESEQEASLLLAKNSGFALAPDKTRRPFRSGEEIDLWPEAIVRLPNGYLKFVADLVVSNGQAHEVLGDRFVVASWNDVLRPPIEGAKVHWEGSNRALNGEAADFRARPIGAGEQGEPEDPLYVLIRKEDNRIQAFSPSRKEMVAELARLEKNWRELAVDWEKHTFSEDLQQYRVNHSM